MNKPTLLMRTLLMFFVSAWFCEAAKAQNASPITAPQTVAAQSQTVAPPALFVYFEMGSNAIRNEGETVLDEASRAYSEGKPIVMILTGGADRTGRAAANLLLSQRRATAVLNGLLARGIPAERFQILAKGETEPAVPTDQNVAERLNRRVEITWR